MALAAVVVAGVAGKRKYDQHKQAQRESAIAGARQAGIAERRAGITE